MRDGGFEHGAELSFVARERASNESCAQFNGEAAGVDGWKIVDHSRFQFRAEIGGRGELALRQTVDAIVLDDIDHGQIAAHKVNKLADADGSGIAITADAERDEIAIGQHRACCDRRHASVNRVEAVRAVHEVRGTLRRAANAAHLDDTFRSDAHVVHGFDDALGNGIVATTSTERSFTALIVDDCEADAVGLRFWSPGFSGWRGSHFYLPSILVNSSVTERASSGRPSRWAMLRRRAISSGVRSSLSRLSICASRFCSTT